MQDWYSDENFWRLVEPFSLGISKDNEAITEVEGIIALTGVRPGESLLDLCCGKGRHALRMAAKGFHVTGLDLCKYFLDVANNESNSQGLDIEWIRCDSRDFVRQNGFDGVYSLFTSFGYFSDPMDDLKVLKNIYNSIKDGGWIIVEFFAKEIELRRYQCKVWYEIDGGYLLEKKELDNDNSIAFLEWSFLKNGIKKVYQLQYRFYSADEVVELLTMSGFVKITLFGDLSGHSYDDDSLHLYAFARK